MNRTIKITQIFFRYLLPVVLISVYILKTYFYPDVTVFERLYILLLTSLVGYFTNFIAIKMLFHPKKKTLLGRQGMIPANHLKIAEKLGNNIADRFFLPEDISKYLLDQKIIHQMVDQGKQTIHDKLSQPKTQEKIRLWLYHILDKNTDKIQVFFDYLASKDWVTFFESRVPVKTFLDYLTQQIEKGVKDGSIDLQKIAEWLAGVLHEYTPQITQLIYEQFQGYMDQQSSIKKGTLKLIQWMSDFEPEKIQKILYERFASEEFRKQAYRTVREWVSRLIDYLKTEEGARKVSNQYHQFIENVSSWIQKQGMPLAVEKLKQWLSYETSWKSIENILMFILKFIEKESHYFVRSRTFKKLVNHGTQHALNHIDISRMIRDKVKDFNTDELETLILNTSGDQLGAIEVLGGFLGAFTGIAIFNPHLFFMILFAILMVFLIEILLGNWLSKD